MPNTAKYPAAIAADLDLLIASNRQTATLTGNVASGDMTIATSTQAFVAPCAISIDNELILISVATPTLLTVAPSGRGFDGTSAALHLQGVTVNVNVIDWHHNQLAAEIKAIESSLGKNLINVINVNATAAGLPSAAYNWSQAPGGSISPGVSIVTLSPVPLGVNGTDVNHYVYISGGTGTAEAALIIGGTSVAGAASGTLIFTAANSHSGAFTIASASSGIVEALNTLPANGGKVLLPTGDINIYQTLIIGAGTATTPSPINALALIGQGSGRGDDIAFPTQGATRLLWAGPAGGTVVKVLGPIGGVLLSDFQIDGASSANIGLDIVHSYSSIYRNINIAYWNLIGLRSMAVDFNFIGMVVGNNGNLFENVVASGGTGGSGSVGAQLGQAVPNVNSIFDFASNTFVNCGFSGGAGVGLELRFADNNTFLMTAVRGNTAALKFTQTGSSLPAANMFFQCPLVGAIIASPSTFIPSTPNFAFPLALTDSFADYNTVQGYLTGIESNFGNWFGRNRSIPLYYANSTSSGAVANTSAQTTFGKSYTIAANLLGIQGATVKVRTAGRYSTTGAPTLTITVKIGGVTVGEVTVACASGASNFSWSGETSMTVGSIGSGGNALRGYTLGTGGAGNNFAGSISLNTTIAQVVEIFAKWNVAASANSAILDAFTVDLSYPGAIQ